MSWTLVLSLLATIAAVAWALSLLRRLSIERRASDEERRRNTEERRRGAEERRRLEDEISAKATVATDLDLARAECNSLARKLRAKDTEMVEKDAEMERFIYTVSHDLKSPLITTQGFLGLLDQDTAAGDVDRMKRDVARIRGAVDVMKKLLEDLLELSRIGRMVNPPSRVRWSSLAEQAVKRIAVGMPEHGVEIEVAPDLPVVEGDQPRLLQAIQNLIHNAVRFSAEVENPRVEIGAEVIGEEVVCHVRDNGIGVDPKFHTKIFGLFDQLASNTEGTGIGLALVERIANVHGGRAWVESEGEGRGSTLFFALPRPSEE